MPVWSLWGHPPAHITASNQPHERKLMNLQESHIQALRSLIEQSPSLLIQLRQSHSPAEHAGLLSKAARQAGIPVDEMTTLARLDEILLHSRTAKLNDTQLEDISGGLFTKTLPTSDSNI